MIRNIKIKFILFISILLFVNRAVADMPRYSYCSNGRCMTITNEYFHQGRGMPLDLNFVCAKDNQYALTFDDGPSANFEQLLDVLQKHDVKATFFINGQNINKDNRKSIIRAYQEGHDISNHTLNHIDLTSRDYTEQEVLNQLEQNRNLIVDLIAKNNISRKKSNLYIDLTMRVLRPPFGNIDERLDDVLKANNYYAVRWNADRYDWNLDDTDKSISTIYNRILQQLDYIDLYFNSSLIDTNSIMDLNHDFRLSSIKALDKAIPMIKQRGYEFVSITQCIGLRP